MTGKFREYSDAFAKTFFLLAIFVAIGFHLTISKNTLPTNSVPHFVFTLFVVGAIFFVHGYLVGLAFATIRKIIYVIPERGLSFILLGGVTSYLISLIVAFIVLQDRLPMSQFKPFSLSFITVAFLPGVAATYLIQKTNSSMTAADNKKIERTTD